MLQLNCINVGYGDAFLFQSNAGTCLLDTGSGMPEEYNGFPERINIVDFLSYKNIRHIDHLILTHIHEDHVGNLGNLLNSVSIGRIWMPKGFAKIQDIKIFEENTVFQKNSSRLFLKALREFAGALDFCAKNNLRTEELGEGAFEEVSGLKLSVLGPIQSNLDIFLGYYEELRNCNDSIAAEKILEKMDAFSNHTSILLKIEYKSFRGLFCADNIPGGWSKNIEKYLADVNFIKLPHHGQKDAIDRGKMRTMPIEFCVTTSSSERRYKSADPVIYRTLREWADEDGRKLKIFFTDPSEEYKGFDEVEYGNRNIIFEIGKTIRYKYENEN